MKDQNTKRVWEEGTTRKCNCCQDYSRRNTNMPGTKGDVEVLHQRQHSRGKVSMAGNDAVAATTKESTLGRGRGKRPGRPRGRRKTANLPITDVSSTCSSQSVSLGMAERSGSKKTSFDPNVDEEADSEPPTEILNNMHNGYLTPSDSDDEQLPDVSFVNDDSALRKGALVWVTYRKIPFWPALVLQIYKKKGRIQKLTILFIGNMGVKDTDPVNTRPRFKKLRLAYKSSIVIPFGNKNAELKHRGSNSEFSKAFKESVQTAEDYSCQRALGKVTDYKSFFAEDIGNAEELYMRQLEAEGAFDEETLRKVIPEVPAAVTSEEEEQSQQEDFWQEDSFSEENMTEADRKRKRRRYEQSAKLVEVMTSTKAMEFLHDIREGKVESEYHQKYQAAITAKEKSKLKYHGYGPILDDHYDDLIQQLVSWSSKKYGDHKVPLSYLLDVWLPELAIYAIQRVRKISKEKAEVTFNAGIRSTKKERQEMKDAMLRCAETDPEELERHALRRKRFMEEHMAVLLQQRLTEPHIPQWTCLLSDCY